MEDPNKRPRRHGKPRSNAQQGYTDSKGSLRASSARPNDSRHFYSSADQSNRAPLRNAADQSNRAPLRSAPGQPGSDAVNGARNSPPPKKKNRIPLFFKAFLLVLLCIFAGLFWHYQNTKDLSDSLHANGSGTNQDGGASAHAVVTPGNTDSTIGNTGIITYSNDSKKPLFGKVIFLEAGHGGSDSGCVYPSKNPKFSESIINLRIAESTKDALEAQGATVIMLRTGDSWISLYHRIALTHLYCLQYADEFERNTISSSDKSRLIGELSDTIRINSDTIDTGGMGIMVGTGVGPDLKLLMDLEKDFSDVLYLSIHTNSNPSSSLHGTQVYYVTDASVIESEKKMVAEDATYRNNPDFPVRQDYYGRSGTKNELLAMSLYNSIIKYAPMMEANAKNVVADNYAVLRETNLTGAMIEVGFITNSKDRESLTDSVHLAQIAGGIASGCINFFSGTP